MALKADDLKYQFEEIYIPAIERMALKESKHIDWLKTMEGEFQPEFYKQELTLALNTLMLYNKRIVEYKKYASEL